MTSCSCKGRATWRIYTACSVLQFVAVRCSVLQCVAACCRNYRAAKDVPHEVSIHLQVLSTGQLYNHFLSALYLFHYVPLKWFHVSSRVISCQRYVGNMGSGKKEGRASHETTCTNFWAAPHEGSIQPVACCSVLQCVAVTTELQRACPWNNYWAASSFTWSAL